GMFGQSLDLRTFLTKRADSVLAQAEGKSQGFQPRGFGGPGGPGGFNPAQNLAAQIFKAAEVEKEKKISKEKFLDGAKKLFAAWDKDKKGSLDEKALADGINSVMMPGNVVVFPGGPGGFPGGLDQALRGIELDQKQKAKVEDIKAAQQKQTQELFEKLRDGKLKPDEMRQASEKIRDEVLKDMKDVLTKEQYEKFEKAFKAGPGGPGGPGGFPGGPGGPGGRPAFGPGQLY